MSNRPNAYIGISGVVNPEQQTYYEGIAAALDFPTLKRRLLLGVKAVHKTQFFDTENKYGSEWYPIGEQPFATALKPRDEAATHSLAIAQTYFEPEYIGNPGYRDHFVQRILTRGAPWIDGIQFDMLPWHNNPAMLPFLQQLKERSGTQLLLQAHKPAMDELGPEGVVAALAPFASSLDYLLFDASHGTGKKLDVDSLRHFIEAAYQHKALGHIGIALAGGLSAQVVEEALPPIVADFPDISWDAEGQLHPVQPDSKARPLDRAITTNYLAASRSIL